MQSFLSRSEQWSAGFLVTFIMILSNFLAVGGLGILIDQPIFVDPKSEALLQAAQDYTGWFAAFSYIIPAVLSIMYFSRALQIGSDEKNKKYFQRILSGPLVISLIGMIGWFIAFVLFLIGWFALSLNQPSFILTIFFRFFMSALVTFVFTYYFIDNLNRRFLVHRFFPNNDISNYQLKNRINVNTRFLIDFLTISIFPIYVFFIIFMNINNTMMKNGLDELMLPIILLIVFFIAFGFTISTLSSRYFSTPLRRLKIAVDKIRSGDFNINIPVTSNDELGLLTENLNQLSRELDEKQKMHATFGRVVDPKVRDYLLEGKGLGGELRAVTIFYSDIRNFTTISEDMNPRDIVFWLNTYFQEMTDAIEKHGGVINKFIGDAILAVFGAPDDLADHAHKAVLALREIKSRMPLLNQKLASMKLPLIQHGMALHTGTVLAGTIGSDKRQEYTIIGDAVNMAARFEGVSKKAKSGIVLSDNLVSKLSPTPDIRPFGRVRVKGSSQTWKLRTLV